MDIPSEAFIQRARTYTVTSAPVPVKVDISLRAIESGLQERHIESLLAIASWQNTSAAAASGRSFIMPINEPLEVSGKLMHAIKIKQVTDRGARPSMVQYVPGQEEIIGQPNYRLLIDNDGTIRVGDALPHPRGTGYLYEAVNEFEMMTEAFNLGINTGFPLAVGQFMELSFMDQPVGFVAVAIEDQKDARIGPEIYEKLLTEKTHSEYRSRIISGVSQIGTGTRSASLTLGRLNRAGMTHNNPYLANFGLEGSDGEAPLYDFTNAKPVRQMGREEFVTRMFNDMRHLYYGTFLIVHQDQLSPRSVNAVFRSLELPNPFEMSFFGADDAGYFTREMARTIGQKRLRDAMDPITFLMGMARLWNPEKLDGTRIRDIDHQSLQVFLEIADTTYDDLTT